MRPSIMLKTPRNYKFATVNDTMSKLEYKIDVANLLRISISPNDGFNKVNFITENTQLAGGRDYFEVYVAVDGTVKLPLVGYINVLGKTTRQVEEEVEKLYQNYYVKPFVTVLVMNRRVMVFPGGGGTGRAVTLVDYNTTLYEVLAQAGGIVEDGKAYRIKLVRNVGGKSQVYKIDLSTVNGIPHGNMVVMANDLVYVEPRFRFASRFVNEITPFLTLFSTSLIIYSLVKK
jgi:polysaccharide biosynthesis/export protein